MHQHPEHRGGHAAHRRELRVGVIGQRFVKAGIDGRHARGGHQHGVAVGLGVRHRGGADGAARAWPVLDHDALAPLLVQFACQLPRQNVGAAAGGKRHHQPDRRGRIRIGRQRGIAAAQGDTHGRGQENANGFHRVVFSVASGWNAAKVSWGK
ncbi:hypothetical protein D3C72_1514710 [compost metagenome]